MTLAEVDARVPASQVAAGSTSPAIIDSLRDELSELQRTAVGTTAGAERQQLFLLEGESYRSLAEAAAQPKEHGELMGSALQRYLAAADAGGAEAAAQSAQASLRLALLVNDLLRVRDLWAVAAPVRGKSDQSPHCQ